jgi:16S rRNA (uracil1498-N3)-methyltransferase
VLEDRHTPSPLYSQLKRFFLPKSFHYQGQLPQSVLLEEPNLLNYLRNVLRLTPQNSVLAVDETTQQVFQATLQKLSRHEGLLELSELLPQTRTASLPIDFTLALVVLKGQRWDWLLQKVTELGVTRIQPLTSRYSVVHVETGAEDAAKKLARWQDIVEAAASQSERVSIPEILPPVSMQAYLELLSTQTPAITASRLLLQEPRGDAQQPVLSLKERLTCLSDAANPRETLTIAIGPEGGWHPDELTAFYGAGFLPTSLGNTILRAETAAMMAASAVLYECSAR